MNQGKSITVLIADDDEDDRFLTKRAWAEARVLNDLYFAKDGEEVMNYLHRIGKYADAESSPRPDFILLDLNMPKKDGREVLQEIKADPKLRQIPVIVLTTSKAEEDIYRTYDLGASSFITKPVTFGALVEVLEALGNYWIEIVELPEKKRLTHTAEKIQKLTGAQAAKENKSK